METDVQPSSIVVTGFGAITPAGENATQSNASYQAGIVAISEHTYMRCTPEEPEWDLPLPLFAASVPTLDPMLQGMERYLQLSIPALEEALDHAKLLRCALPTTGLLIATHQPHSDSTEVTLQQAFFKQLRNRMGLTGLNTGHVSCAGHTGTTEAIHQAMKILQAGKLQHVIILAVDTYLLEQRITHYDGQWRIKSERNIDGFTPGEAACALVLEQAATASSRNAEVQGYIKGCGFGHETNNLSGNKATTGEGLRQAINCAISGDNDARFANFYSDFNGESYYAYEMGLLQPRFPEVFSELEKRHYPATCFGNTGTANTALSIMLACLNGRIKKPKNVRNLIISSNDDGKRAALVLETVQ